VKISHFDNARDNVPKQGEITWEFFASGLGPHEYRQGGHDEAEDKRAKECCPCFSPAEYLDGTERGNKAVLRLWMLVLDVDHIDEATAYWIFQRLQELGLAAVVYSSWRHGRDPWRFRVVIPLDAPVDAARWANFWVRAITLFGNVCDPACKDPARLYFGPFAPYGTEHLNFYWVYQGGALATEAVWALPLPEGVRDTQAIDGEERRTKDSEAVALLAAAWPAQRRHEAHLALSGGLLSSGVSDERAVEFLCAVARQHEGSDEERDKRESAVEHTREQLDANEKITGWTTLASIVGYDVVEKVRALVERAPDISLEQLTRYSKELKKSKFDNKRELGDALEKVCERRVFPEPLALKLAAELGARYVDYNAKSIAAFFTESLRVMVAEGEDVTVEQVEARIKLKQDEVRLERKERRQKEEQQQREVEHDKASRVREAYKNGRSHPYTLEELQRWTTMIGTGHRWVIQKDRSFYFFFNGSYKGPYTEAEAHNAALRELAPAASAGVELYKFTKDGGAEFKSLKQIVAEYGTVADRIITDLRAQIVTYVEQDRAIVEAPCPLRQLEPVYDPDVDRWMYEMAGDQYDDLKTWFALLPNLDTIRAALALIGVHSVGKSMSALAGSGLFTTTGPTTLEQALAPFNDSILHCPLIFADEHLPKDFRGNAPTEQLRAFIQATERPLKRKHMPNSKCLGVTPLLIAAHDAEVLKPSHDISNNEVAGTMERFKIVFVREGAAQFLANLRPTTHERGWISRDVIAKHIWWLYYNHKHAPQGRFYFKPGSSEQAMWWATSGGAKGSLLRYLVSFLADRRKFEGDINTNMLVRVYKGHLLVNIYGPLQYWDKYIGNEKCPSAGHMARLLASIAYPDRVKLPNGKGKMTNYRVVISDYLFTWANGTDIISSEELSGELAVDSKQTSVGLVRSI